MEVCQKCHQEIKPEDKWIIGDPDKLFKSAMAGFSAGLNNNHNRYNRNIPQLEHCKYHLECYEIAKKKSNKGIIWTLLGLSIIGGIIILITLVVVGII